MLTVQQNSPTKAEEETKMAHEEDIAPQVFSCLLSKDEQTGRWLAHCLDFDLMTSAKSQDIAWENLRKVVRAHIEHCFTFHQDGLKMRAEDHEWANFREIEVRLKEQQIPIRTEKITLKLTPTKSGRELWIRGVEILANPAATPSIH